MTWLLLALGSALFLGIYDICKKRAVNRNAVWPMLLICSATNVVLLLIWQLLANGLPEVPALKDHLTLLVKAAIVSGSWVFTYSAIARLPLSTTSPIRATAPIFTMFMATIFMGERLLPLQWIGFASCFAGHMLFRFGTKREQKTYWRHPFVIAMFFGTFLGSCSGVYDKVLLQRLGYDPFVLQLWFNIYMCVIQGLVTAFYWYPRNKRGIGFKFEFRWIMLLVGALLLVADRFYFLSLHEEGTLVSLVTIIRRSSVIISFIAGLMIFKEKNNPKKWMALVAIVTGLVLIGISSL